MLLYVVSVASVNIKIYFLIFILLLVIFNCVMIEVPLNNNNITEYIYIFLTLIKVLYKHYLITVLKQPHEIFTLIGEP